MPPRHHRRRRLQPAARIGRTGQMVVRGRCARDGQGGERLGHHLRRLADQLEHPRRLLIHRIPVAHPLRLVQQGARRQSKARGERQRLLQDADRIRPPTLSNPDKGERDTVYPVRVNPLINTTQTGLAVWGVRTMSPTSDVLKYVNAVRLFQFVEKSVFNSTFGFVFESITPGLYTRIKTTIDGFLNNLFQSGYLAGSTPLQAYFVVCDHTNNPPEVVNQGQVIVDIGIAPNKPAEFIIFRFSPISGNS